MRLRVAYLASRYPAVSHTFIEREIRGLRERGHDIATFTVRAAPPEDLLTPADRQSAAETPSLLPASAATVASAHLRALRTRPSTYLRALARALRGHAPGVKARLWRLFYFAEAGLLWRQLQDGGIRHVHAHFANVGADVAMLTAAIGGRGWSWSFTMHGSTEFYEVTAHGLPEKIASAAFVACIGDFTRAQMMKHSEPEHWGKLVVVRCGIDPERFAPAPRPPLTGRPFDVLCVGRLFPGKGQTILVDAIAQARARGVDVRLLLAGDGQDRRSLERQAAELGLGDSVEFLGSVGQDAMVALYQRADGFALASFAEGIPVVLMEAMACEVPVISTNVMGVPELVVDGVGGLLVPPGRADAVADALVRLVEDGDLRARLAVAGREHVVAEFDAARSAAAMETQFERVLSGSGSDPRPTPAR